MNFTPDYLRTFVGGRFRIDDCTTVAELRLNLRKMEEELAKWGDNLKIETVWLNANKQTIDVTLTNGSAIGLEGK